MDVVDALATAKPDPAHGGAAILLRPLDALPGIGPAALRLLARLLGRPAPRLFDLLAHLPTDYVDPTPLAKLSEGVERGAVVVDCLVLNHRPSRRPGGVWRVVTAGPGTEIEVVLFGVRGDWPRRRYPEGTTLRLYGRIECQDGRWRMVHPEPLRCDEPGLLPVYPSTAGLTQARLRRLLQIAIGHAPDLPDWFDPAMRRRERMPGWREALGALHRPASTAAASHKACRRLAYDELLATQLALAMHRRRHLAAPGRAIVTTGALRRRLLTTLPFTPTAAQRRAVAEILADMARPSPMLRLLMGDVGSGKTLVALLAMLEAVEAGHQAALMVPTEVLARQHAATFHRLLAPLGLEATLLVGSDRGIARRAGLSAIAAGTARLVIGTHALFQQGVEFANLALAVVDEQHRFGVHQRLRLRGKGSAVDMLLMTATPIPRTLLMSAYGDIAVSRLDGKPPGRRPVTTSAVPVRRLAEVIEALDRALARGERAYWVCPTIDDASGERAAAEVRAATLRERFGAVVGVVHGRLAAAAKAAAMRAFARGELRILVATTAIEVGVDVPEACVIVVEGAGRFGLAQLHQLRGRVGRGPRPGHCLLLYDEPLSTTAAARLRVLRGTDDGFRIAEEDLRLRGPGEVLGTRQSGLPPLRFADLGRDGDLLATAHADAERILERDPSLRTRRGRALRELLALFERDTAAALPAAG